MNPNFFKLTKSKKRDVLTELLTGKHAEGLISKKELKALYRIIGETPQAEAKQVKEKDQPKKKAAGGNRKRTSNIKTTHYLSEEIVDSLESLQKDLRTMVPEHQRSKISRSQIINQALVLVLEEFKTKGDKSRLVRKMFQKS